MDSNRDSVFLAYLEVRIVERVRQGLALVERADLTEYIDIPILDERFECLLCYVSKILRTEIAQ